MKAAAKAIRWPPIAVVSAVAVWCAYLGALEGYEYLTRSETKARAAAEKLFAEICDKEGFDRRSFSGPDRPSVDSDTRLGVYSFAWTRAPGETIYVHVTYLPYDLPHSISQSLIESRRP